MSQQGAAAGAGGKPKLAHHVSWLWRGSRRALSAALDLYVRVLTGCGGHIPADAAFGYPTFAGPSFGSSASSSRRSSSAAADEDLRELIRAAEHERQRHPAAVPRSRSVSVAGAGAMARIDEDGPCDDDFASSASAAAVFPRSRSCAPGAGTGRIAAAAARRRGRVAA